MQTQIPLKPVDKQKVKPSSEIVTTVIIIHGLHFKVCVASSIHANYPYINDIIQDCAR